MLHPPADKMLRHAEAKAPLVTCPRCGGRGRAVLVAEGRRNRVAVEACECEKTPADADLLTPE